MKTASIENKIFVVEYSVIGSRCNGTYLVNAPTKKDANGMIKKIDHAYTRVKSHHVKYPLDLENEAEDNNVMGCCASDIINPEAVQQVINKPNSWCHLESGT